MFLSLPTSPIAPSGSKAYTKTVLSRAVTQPDTNIIVRHDDRLKTIARKDLGSRMVCLRTDIAPYIAPTPDLSARLRAWTLFSGYDEQSGQGYFFVPKMSNHDLTKKLDIYTKVCGETITSALHIDISSKRVSLPAYIQPIPAQHQTHIYDMILGLYILYGSVQVKDGSLISAKIQIPYTPSMIGLYTDIYMTIHAGWIQGYMLSYSDTRQGDHGTIQITISDYDILVYIRDHIDTIDSGLTIRSAQLATRIQDALAIDYGIYTDRLKMYIV